MKTFELMKQDVLKNAVRISKKIKDCKKKTGHTVQDATFIRILNGKEYICCYCKNCPVVLPLRLRKGGRK